MRVIVFLSLLSFSCINNTNVIGVYKNTAESGVNHYIELKPNGFFEHVYEKDTLRLVNKGKWKYHSQKNQISIDNWVGFGVFKNDQCDKGCYATIIVKGDELILSKDLPDRNFKKYK